MARIDDGHPTLIQFSLDPDVKLWEKTIKPPGLDAGGPNDTTTMRNIRWRTRQPKKLITMTPLTGTFAYDPVVYDELEAMLGINQLLTVLFADGSSVAAWGWLDKFEPGDSAEGGQPTASVTVEFSNQNDSQVETGPVYTA